MALRALTPLPYLLSAPMAATAETMGSVRGVANPLESLRRGDSDITRLAGGRRPLTRELDSDGNATHTAPHDSEVITWCQIRTRPGGSGNPKEFTLGWVRVLELQSPAGLSKSNQF